MIFYEIAMFVSNYLYDVFPTLPGLPPNATGYMEQGLSYITSGVGILANYTDIEYLLILLGILITIDIGIAVYHFVMWVIRKLPISSE